MRTLTLIISMPEDISDITTETLDQVEFHVEADGLAAEAAPALVLMAAEQMLQLQSRASLEEQWPQMDEMTLDQLAASGARLATIDQLMHLPMRAVLDT